MLGRGRFFFHRLKIDLYRVALVQRRQDTVLLRGIIVLHPSLFHDDGALQREFLEITHGDFDFGTVGNAFFGAEYRCETAEYGGIHQHLSICELGLVWYLVRGCQRRVRFYLAVIKDVFAFFEYQGIANRFGIFNDLADFILFGCCQIFRVGTGIGQISFLVQSLDDLQAFGHGHLVLLSKEILQLGKGVELARRDYVFLLFHGGDDGRYRIVSLAQCLRLRKLLFREFFLACQLHGNAIRFRTAHQCVIDVRYKMADSHVPIVDRTNDGNDYPSHPQKSACFQSGITGQIHAVQPIYVCSGEALIG